jgi:hypothetical protein
VVHAVCPNCGAVDLEELERLEKAATPGPWHVDGGIIRDKGGRERADVSCNPRETGDGALIAAARNALPGLIARLRTAEECHEAWLATWEDDMETQAQRDATHNRWRAAIAAYHAARPK